MYKLIFASALLTTLFVAASCNKCYECNLPKADGTTDSVSQEFCSEDYPDKTDGLMLTINDYEAWGAVCTKK